MDARILVCGLNGVGKSTLGRFLAERIGCAALDIESYYFPVRHDYLCHRTPEEAYALLRRDMERLPSFVLASLRGDPSWPLTHVVLLGAPAQIRAGRVRRRSAEKFGIRMMPSGDLYESEERFFAKCAGREESEATDWMSGIPLPCLILDGTLPPGENAERVVRWIADRPGDVRTP